MKQRVNILVGGYSPEAEAVCLGESHECQSGNNELDLVC